MVDYLAIYEYAGKELQKDIETINQILSVFGKKYGSTFIDVELKFRHNIKESFGKLEGENAEQALREFLQKTTEARNIVHTVANCFYSAIGNLSSNYKLWNMVYASAKEVHGFSDSTIGILAIDLSQIKSTKDSLIITFSECHKKILDLEILLNREIELINSSLGKSSVKEILLRVHQAEELFLEEKRRYIELLELLSFRDKNLIYLVKISTLMRYYSNNYRNIWGHIQKDFRKTEMSSKFSQIMLCLIITSGIGCLIYSLKNAAVTMTKISVFSFITNKISKSSREAEFWQKVFRNFLTGAEYGISHI
jgi:hypothetical protein